MRARPDLMSDDMSIILEYKTTSAPNIDAFCRSTIPYFGYDIQDVFYRRGLKELTGIDAKFVFLVQEDFEPYSCYLVELSPARVELAESKVERAIEKWSKCISTDHWPAYEPTIYTADAAAWEIMKEEEA
jgi:hypothetical protein